MDGLKLKGITLDNAGGPHPISWRPSEQKLSFHGEEGILPQDCTSNPTWVSSLRPPDFRFANPVILWPNSLKYISFIIIICIGSVSWENLDCDPKLIAKTKISTLFRTVMNLEVPQHNNHNDQKKIQNDLMHQEPENCSPVARGKTTHWNQL